MSNVPAVLPHESKRDYAVRLGLAQQSRGRMSADAHAAIDAAIDAGFTFSERVATPPKPKVKTLDRVVPDLRPTANFTSSSPVPGPVPVAPRPQVAPVEKSESKIIRAWAKTQDGLTVGDRGRLHPDVIAAYRDAHGTAPATAVEVHRPTPNDMPKRTNIVGLGTRNGITHAQDICGNLSCGRSISRCQCHNGPQALGGVTGTLRLV